MNAPNHAPYRPGEKLRVVIDPAVVSRLNDNDGPGTRDLLLNITGPDGSLRVVVDPDHSAVSIERLAPAQWPGPVGTLWRDPDDVLWMSHGNKVMLGTNGQRATADAVWHQHGPLTRVGVDDVPVVEATEPTPVVEPGPVGDEREQVLAGLRALIRFLTEHPELPLPYDLTVQGGPSLALDWDQQRELVVDVARALGRPLDTDEPDNVTVRLPLGGGVKYVVHASRLTPPAPDDPDADQPLAEHWQVAGSAGGVGECGAECACGVTFDGFDTLAGAEAALAVHIDGEAAKS